MLPLYLRREPTTDPVTLAHDPDAARRRDVVAYSDPACTIRKGRWPWHHSTKPRRNCRTVTLNCFRWAAHWLPDADAPGPAPAYPVAPNGLVLLYQGAR